MANTFFGQIGENECFNVLSQFLCFANVGITRTPTTSSGGRGSTRLRPIRPVGRPRNWPKSKLAEVELTFTTTHRRHVVIEIFHMSQSKIVIVNNFLNSIMSFFIIFLFCSYFCCSFPTLFQSFLFVSSFSLIFLLFPLFLFSPGPPSSRDRRKCCSFFPSPAPIYDSPRTPNVHISGSPRFIHHQNSTRRHPKEGRMHIRRKPCSSKSIFIQTLHPEP